MGKWDFRPSALSLLSYSTTSSERLVEQYLKDNKRADEADVKIHARPESAFLRTLQWNIHGWTTATNDSSPVISKGIRDAIFNADADVVILNEYDWENRDGRHIAFERKLREQGYTFYCATVFCPTAVATRLHVNEVREIRLSEERSALVLNVEHDLGSFWVIGTHLDHLNGQQRRQEIDVLMQELELCCHDDDRIVMAGDLNQQRRQDYTKAEWKLISESMTRRKACQDDGVAVRLKKARFVCAWDGLHPSKSNWATSKPPSTHWSGSVVDYSYGRNVQADGVSVSKAGWSDHRMTVCDWKWTTRVLSN